MKIPKFLTFGRLGKLETALARLESGLRNYARHAVSCARCGVKVDITQDRPAGPRLMERTSKAGETAYIVACNVCQPLVKRNGWIKARPEQTKATTTTLPEGAEA